MRKLILLGLVASIAVPAWATRHLTVAQLEKTLASGVARHHTDADMMREFGDFDLTERLTDATRTRICDSLHLGPQTTLALQLIGDESATLDPPAAELPADAAPDAATAAHILSAATAYVTQTLPHLPDFLATRSTYTFNDTAQILKVNEWPVNAGLHLVKNTNREITFRDDHEVTAPTTQAATASAGAAAPASTSTAIAASTTTPASGAGPVVNSAHAMPDPGLQSYGEFGQLLGVILIDTAKSKPAFHHWERTSAGLVAVYRYSVAKPDSHYAVNYCCLFDGLRTRQGGGGGGRRGGGGGGVMGTQQSSSSTLFHKIPGYHGSLFIDPSSGVIRRMTLDAELGDGLVSRAATVIEYGPVTIGERKFICPLRSMNIYEGPPEFGPQSSEIPVASVQALEPKGTLYVNETSFTNYHRLGSEMRIITEAENPVAAHN
jgi:hypothetical protein